MSVPEHVESIEVLLVEDDPGDVVLIQEAFEDNKVRNRLHCVSDGVDALRFLRRQDEFADAPRPDLILLDLNLPRKDGREVLAEVKADPELRRIPIVVLSTSRAERDVVKSYDLNANCYIVKPADLDEFVDVICSTERFWLDTVTRSPR